MYISVAGHRRPVYSGRFDEGRGLLRLVLPRRPQHGRLPHHTHGTVAAQPTVQEPAKLLRRSKQDIP